MVEILKGGQFLQIDSEGYVINKANLKNLVEPWKALAIEIIQLLLTNLKSDIHSIYLRGSVANGSAIQGASDIDFLIVIHVEEEKLDHSWEDDLIKIKTMHYFCGGIDIKYANHQNLLASDDHQYAYTRMLLKTQSFCIHGQSLDSLISRYKPGKSMVTLSPFIEKDISTSIKFLENTGDSSVEYITPICQWIATQIIRVGFEMVIENERVYTRDLYLCFEAFARHFPAHKLSMERVLHLALDPHPDREQTLALLYDFGSWIVIKVKNKV